MVVSPSAVLFGLVGGVLFARGFRRLRARRPAYAGWDRAVLFALALLAGLVAMSSRLDRLAEESLAAHMFQHVLLADVAPALVLVALRGPLLYFVVPEFLLRAVARSPRARAFLSALTNPVVAFGIWAGTIALWHLPALYGATLTSAPLHLLEHVSFALAGLVAWVQVVDPARRGSLGTVGRLVFVLGMLTVGQVLATAFVLAQDPLYEAYAGSANRLLDMTALADQDAAGFVMMLEQLLVLGVAAGFLLRRHLHEVGAAAAATDPAAHPFVA